MFLFRLFFFFFSSCYRFVTGRSRGANAPLAPSLRTPMESKVTIGIISIGIGRVGLPCPALLDNHVVQPLPIYQVGSVVNVRSHVQRKTVGYQPIKLKKYKCLQTTYLDNNVNIFVDTLRFALKSSEFSRLHQARHVADGNTVTSTYSFQENVLDLAHLSMTAFINSRNRKRYVYLWVYNAITLSDAFLGTF